jgi:NAD(P)-dependent dehydrogenase (short-subunit alcohol dehydrogenase family)
VTESVLVTGANKGLGLCLVEAFLATDARVFAGFRAPAPALDELAARNPGRLTLLALDVTDAAQVRSAADAVREQGPGLDILINNAAILPEAGRGPLASLNVELGRELFDTNALGPLRVTQAFLPLLRAGKRKLVVNVSSEAGSVGDCSRTEEHLYCMTKAALNMQSAILRNDLGREGFEILAVHPGWMRTEMGGPNARIDPRDAADGIVALTRRRRSAAEPFYVDYRGEALRF